MRYRVLIDGEPGAYGVVFPDLPGCTAMGDTIEAALSEAATAALEWSRVAVAHGDAASAPRTISVLRNDPDVMEALALGSMLGSAAVIRDAGRPVKANLSLDAGVPAAIDAVAEDRKLTRSAMVEALAREHLPSLA